MNIIERGFVGILGSLAVSEVYEQSMMHPDTNVVPPIDKISIIMPSYNEENHIEKATSSVRNQSILEEYPESFEFILIDSESTDNTVDVAKPYVDKIIMAPRGKLTARNIATDMAQGNIIVSTDSDTFYPYHWLNTLLKPFNDIKYLDQNIAGTVGSTIDYGIPKIPGIFNTMFTTIDRIIINPHQMIGRNSAYYKHFFYLAKRFNENINQLDLHAMLNEEEKGFGVRLSKFGKIKFVSNAPCVHLGGQKVGCRTGTENKDICAPYGFGKDRF